VYLYFLLYPVFLYIHDPGDEERRLLQSNEPEEKERGSRNSFQRMRVDDDDGLGWESLASLLLFER
jgi:hypothetical protein